MTHTELQAHIDRDINEARTMCETLRGKLKRTRTEHTREAVQEELTEWALELKDLIREAAVVKNGRWS
tara:strand:- start:344 stop:547 length:204 start_codon:yes stop_codon:yes gene_type:complete